MESPICLTANRPLQGNMSRYMYPAQSRAMAKKMQAILNDLISWMSLRLVQLPTPTGKPTGTLPESPALPRPTLEQAQSPFFRLPAEVREMIYKQYLAHTWDQFAVTRTASAKEGFPDGNFSMPLPALMTTCKRLYRELSPRARRHAALMTYHLGWVAFWGQDTAHGAAVYGPLRYERLRKLTLIFNANHGSENYGWGRGVLNALDQAVNVQEITFELYAVPERSRDVIRWFSEKDESVLMRLKRLPKLEVIRLRGLVPDALVELVRQETRAKVVTSALDENWTIESRIDDGKGRLKWQYARSDEPVGKKLGLGRQEGEDFTSRYTADEKQLRLMDVL